MKHPSFEVISSNSNLSRVPDLSISYSYIIVLKLYLFAYIEDFLELMQIVNTFSVELKLKFVSDLLEAVFPIHIF
jgi:hypothetical protein